MTRVLEWKTSVDYNKHDKSHHHRGYALIDQVYSSHAELEEAVNHVNDLHKRRWKVVMQKLQCTNSHEVPAKIQRQLADLHAEELRQVYGRDRKDANPITKPKRIDLVVLAKKYDFPIGDENWGRRIVDAIEDGTIDV